MPLIKTLRFGPGNEISWLANGNVTVPFHAKTRIKIQNKIKRIWARLSRVSGQLQCRVHHDEEQMSQKHESSTLINSSNFVQAQSNLIFHQLRLHSMNHAQTKLTTQLKFHVSLSIFNHFFWFKAQHNHGKKTYKKHGMILRLVRVEILPCLKDRDEAVVVWLCNVETGAHEGWYWWIEARLEAQIARISSNTKLPWMKLQCSSIIPCSTVTIWCLQKFQGCWWMVNQAQEQGFSHSFQKKVLSEKMRIFERRRFWSVFFWMVAAARFRNDRKFPLYHLFNL